MIYCNEFEGEKFFKKKEKMIKELQIFILSFKKISAWKVGRNNPLFKKKNLYDGYTLGKT